MANVALPRGPRSHWLVGHLPELARDQLGFYRRCAAEYGDFVPFRLGTRPAVLVSHPDDIESVLVTHGQNFVKGPLYGVLRPLLGEGLLTSDGEFWRRQRRLAQPAFHRERTAGYAGQMVEYAARMVAGWRDGEERDVHADMMRLTLQVVCKSLFDADVATEAVDVGSALQVALEQLHSELNTVLALLPHGVPTPGRLRLRRSVERLDRIVLGLIAERRRSGHDPGDLLSLLMKARDDDGSAMSDRQLRDEAMTLILAGHETTALALSWAWYLLARHPEALGGLEQELAATLAGRSPTAADLPSLRFAESVGLESMRLYPPVAVIGRYTVRECEIGGHRLPEGMQVALCQWVVHRDARHFEDPDAFRPERWMDGLARRLPRYAYFPFGGGPRLCIGQGFAMMEMVLLLATIAQRFRFTLVPGHRVVPHTALTLRPKYGIRMRLHSR
jgi:cytochrome P450